MASELGDEWKKLAQYLSLKSVRIQAILRQNNQNPEPKKIRYDMLVTWAKRVPRCLNKVRYCSTLFINIYPFLFLNELSFEGFFCRNLEFNALVFFILFFFQLEILAQALSACGRGDLAIDLRERDEEFRRRRALAFRGVYSILNIKFFIEQTII